MEKLCASLLEGTFKLLSRLPFPLLYLISDVAYVVVRHIAGYRRGVVRNNIANSFPELGEKARRDIERHFYHFLCDYGVETIKLLTIRPEALKRRMTFEGVDLMERSLEKHPFVFIYLGHYCNWEWISSLPLWKERPETHCAQLYRPLKNSVFDRLFMDIRTRFGAENISKYESLRRIMTLKHEGRKTIIGFISDQSPRWQSIHDWVDFLHQDTPVFTGTERIGKKVDAAVYFADVERRGRGRYHCRLRPLTEDIRSYPDYKVTELYMQELETIIRRNPAFWLWSHKRWKHKRRPDGSKA